MQGKHVLDLGCGPGVYCQHFLEQGASVTATDISSEMVELVKKLYGNQVQVYVQNLQKSLPSEADNSADLIVCPLTIHYLDDLMPLLSDVQRVLRNKGSFFFSTHHPMVDFTSSPSGNYFLREQVIEEWDTIGKPVQVQFYRRSLTEFFHSITSAGLYVANLTEGQLTEGQPAAAMKEKYPEQYAYLSTHPNFMFIEFDILPSLKEGDSR